MPMTRKARFRIASLLLVALLGWLLFHSNHRALEPRYRVINIDGLEGIESHPVEIDNNREIGDCHQFRDLLFPDFFQTRRTNPLRGRFNRAILDLP